MESKLNPTSQSIFKGFGNVAVVPYSQAGQHLSGATATNPNSEEDHKKVGGKHHLPGKRGCVPDGQSKGHRPPQA